MRCVIVWATWAVWQEMLSVLATKKIVLQTLDLAWSDRSAWKVIQTYLWPKTVIACQSIDFSHYDVALFAAGSDVSKEFVPRAIASWCRVIDNASLFRYDEHVPLVVPCVNKWSIWSASLIANPNCTTAIAAVVLYPIYQKFGIKTCIMSTYQAASGAGAAWVEELDAQLCAYPQTIDKYTVFPHALACNVIPRIDAVQENGYTKEEMKVVWEMRKIFADPDLAVSCTAVRVPTMRAHAESITIQTTTPIDASVLHEIRSNNPHVLVVDDPSKDIYPLPRTAQWTYPVQVGRIRQSLVFGEYGVDLFVCGDQLLRWAALNAVEILEEIM